MLGLAVDDVRLANRTGSSAEMWCVFAIRGKGLLNQRKMLVTGCCHAIYYMCLQCNEQIVVQDNMQINL